MKHLQEIAIQFIGGDELVITRDAANLNQAITDEGGLTLPFNPVCPGGCDHGDVPEPDGNSDTHQPVDPRWSGLEKFL